MKRTTQTNTNPPAPTCGLGNAIGYLCVSNGNNVKWGGWDGKLCDPGHDYVIRIVVVK
jgi:hypothetical protein